MLKSLKIIFSCLLFLVSCVTNPPDNSTILKEFQKIFIDANISGAEIFVDEISTGKFTPDTITVEVGERIIKLIKENYIPAIDTIFVTLGSIPSFRYNLDFVLVQKLVLLEDFANVSCDPCVPSNLIIHSLSENTYSKEKLVVIKYPTNFPSSTDPFYLANRIDCDSRISYYNVLFAPTIFIDGVLRPVASDSVSIKEKINERLNETADFKIAVADSIGGNTIFIKIKIDLINNPGFDFSKLFLQNVITEDEIEFSSPPGSNGETKFYHVMRKMIPTNSGVPLVNFNNVNSYKYDYQTAIDPAWSLSKIHIVSFIQNVETKVVLQTGSTF